MRSSSALAAVVVTVIFTSAAIITVALRQYGQSIKRNTWTIDSGFLILSLVFVSGHCGLIVYGAVEGGLGWPPQELMEVYLVFIRVVEASQVLTATAISLVRISLLLFYRRVFPIPHFLTADSIMIALTTCWWLQSVIGTTAAIKPDVTDIKINYPVFLLVQAILNFLLDVVTLCLPLFVIRTLHVSRSKKIMITGIFGLGFFCVIASIVRVVYFTRLTSLTFFDIPFSSTTLYCTIWAAIEPCTSIIACCLPACAPLLRKENNGLATILQRAISFFSSLSGNENSGNSNNRTSERYKAAGRETHVSAKPPCLQGEDLFADSYEMMDEDERYLHSATDARNA